VAPYASMEGVDEPRPELRIGDRERRATDAHLQQAHGDGVLTLTEYDERAALCWAARVRSDLDELVRDLPPYRQDRDEPATVAIPGPEGDAVPTKSLGQRLTSGALSLAVLGGALFLGSQIITAPDGVSVFGSRQVSVAPGQERVEMGMLFGSVDVVVPEGVRARPSTTLVFGSTDCALACTGPGPEVVVDVTGAFGSVDIVRPGEPDPGDRDDDEDGDRDGDGDDD
jgi:hypothetical protein